MVSQFVLERKTFSGFFHFFVISVNLQCFIEVVDGRDSVAVEVNPLYTPLPTTDVLYSLLHISQSQPQIQTTYTRCVLLVSSPIV